MNAFFNYALFGACCVAMFLAGCVGGLTPSQQMVAAGVGAGEAVGTALLKKNMTATAVSPAYLGTYESLIPKVSTLMQGGITPADLHNLIGQVDTSGLSAEQLAVVGLLNGVSDEFIRVNGGATPTPDGALADAAAKQFAVGLGHAVGLVTGTNYTPPSS